MGRGWLIGTAMASFAVLLAASVLLAKPGIVKTRDGQRFEGDVTENDDVVTVTVRGVAVNINRRNVTDIEYTASLDDQYKFRHERLSPSDVPGRVALARWAFENHRYDLARTAVDEAIKIEPSNREAREMVDTLDRQAALDRKAPDPRPAGGGSATGGGNDAAPTAPPSTSPTAAAPAGGPVMRMLIDEEINAIRQKEWKPGDPQMHVQFRGDVKKRYVQNYSNDTLQTFNQLKPFEQAQRIFDTKDAALAKDVRVQNDPPPLVEYRRSIQPIIANGCANSGCHGNTANGGFALLYPASGDAAAYTNFYVLQSFVKKVNGVEQRAIDRNYPDKSLVIQYLLADDQSELHHPKVSGFRATLRSKNDANYKKLVEWTKKLAPVQPDYGIDFTIPGAAARSSSTTGPTTTPAAPATQPAGGASGQPVPETSATQVPSNQPPAGQPNSGEAPGAPGSNAGLAPVPPGSDSKVPSGGMPAK